MTIAFNNFNYACPTELLRAKAIVTAAKDLTTLNTIANLVELLRYDLPFGAGVAGPIGGTRGGFVRSLTARPRATLNANATIVLVSSLDNGATYDLREEAVLQQYTATTANDAVPGDFGYTEDEPLYLAPGERLWVGCAVALAAGIVFQAQGDGFS